MDHTTRYFDEESAVPTLANDFSITKNILTTLFLLQPVPAMPFNNPISRLETELFGNQVVKFLNLIHLMWLAED